MLLVYVCFSAVVAVVFATLPTVEVETDPQKSRGIVDWRKTSDTFGRIRKLSHSQIVSNIPEVQFLIYNHEESRKLQRDDGDYYGKRRLNGDDGITSEIPCKFSATIENSITSKGNVCDIGCEGDYSQIYKAFNDLRNDQGKEWEMFFTVQGRYAVAAGVIYNNFPERVEALSREHPNVDTIIIPYGPGSANDNAMVPGATRIHQLGYQTCVPSDGSVASGGTDMFAAGVKRFATPGSKIGIHSWGTDDGPGSDLPRNDPAHQRYLDFYDAICIPQEFYWETMSYGLPMHYISDEEFESKFTYLRSKGCVGPSGPSCTPVPKVAPVNPTPAPVDPTAAPVNPIKAPVYPIAAPVFW